MALNGMRVIVDGGEMNGPPSECQSLHESPTQRRRQMALSVPRAKTWTSSPASKPLAVGRDISVPPSDSQSVQVLPSQEQCLSALSSSAAKTWMWFRVATAHGADENLPPSDCQSLPIVYQIAESVPTAKTARVSRRHVTACGRDLSACPSVSQSRQAPSLEDLIHSA